MSLSELLADERLQFFLRNREDIKSWAGIESDVVAATREILARSQPLIEEALLSVDPDVLVGQRDGGQWERILARHDRWPASVGLSLEWHRSVDPAEATSPKIGVFWWADPPTLIEPRTRFVESVNRTKLLGLGYKVPLEGIWPVGARAIAGPDWWQDPDTWIAGIVERLAAAWPEVAPRIDEVLGVSGG